MVRFQIRLYMYSLIWKRTIASQMSEAQLERTNVKIKSSADVAEHFVANGEMIKFDGFLKVYLEGTDHDQFLLNKPLKNHRTLSFLR